MSRILFLVSIAILLAAGLRAWVVEGIYVASGSMEPTLKTGTHLFLDKVTYRFRDPRPGEIVCFSAPVAPHEEMCKRLVAVAGQTVELKDKALLVDGKAVEERYVVHKRSAEKLVGDNLGPLEVPKEHVFVLGDNRDESKDSSFWRDPATNGPRPFVPMSRVRGLVRGIY
ncbi:MAG: signal peptidase I [Elusimicrobia bacterium]|nr:MAG: signal peptidase I [Elusimicrobiota bacterium]